jgi:iron(II)-dependent oxidoreductase
LGSKSANPEFDHLFAFGIDPIGGGLPTDLPSDWPSLAAVRNYVSGVRSAIDTTIEKIVSEPNFTAHDGFPLSTLLNVAIEHRLMHVETLSYMLHQLPLDMKMRQPNSLTLLGPAVVHRQVAVPAGLATLGLVRGGGEFGWDNEFEAHTAQVPEFEIDRYKVTNRRYLDFVAAGGYETRALWSDDDWSWKIAHEISHPHFWIKDRDAWSWRTMFDEVPLPLDWPVYVTHAEASAYAKWAGKSLPTESEWQRAAYGTSDENTKTHPRGSKAPDAVTPDAGFNDKRGNFDFRRWDPTPVNAFPGGQSAFGADDLLGNGWEWTSTAFGPFPGFEPFPFYRGYSADFFDGQHFVMKGGSARTAACMVRPAFRNWFQAHYQYVYAGFRCVSR